MWLQKLQLCFCIFDKSSLGENKRLSSKTKQNLTDPKLLNHILNKLFTWLKIHIKSGICYLIWSYVWNMWGPVYSGYYSRTLLSSHNSQTLKNNFLLLQLCCWPCPDHSPAGTLPTLSHWHINTMKQVATIATDLQTVWNVVSHSFLSCFIFWNV